MAWEANICYILWEGASRANVFLNSTFRKFHLNRLTAENGKGLMPLSPSVEEDHGVHELVEAVMIHTNNTLARPS